MLDKLRCSQDDPSLIDRFATLFRQWRLSTGLSLALSLAVMGVVLLAALQGGGQAAASPLADDPFSMTVTRGQGDCPICNQADRDYDPDMGWFNLSRTGPPGDTAYQWNRSGVLTETHTLGTFPETNFLFWLHRSKGCGDFEIYGVVGGQTATNIAPFSIPCTGSLASDTAIFGFTPQPSTIYHQEVCAPTCFPTFYNSGPGGFTVNLHNLTATGMQGQMILGFGQIGELVSPVGFIANSKTGAFDVSLFGFEPESLRAAQEVGVVAASPARTTATLVYSFGPTARISQTVILAEPEKVFVPLAERNWGSGW